MVATIIEYVMVMVLSAEVTLSTVRVILGSDGGSGDGSSEEEVAAYCGGTEQYDQHVLPSQSMEKLLKRRSAIVYVWQYSVKIWDVWAIGLCYE